MKRTRTLGFAVMAVLFFTACKREESINIDQQRIYSSYSFEYDSDNNQSHARVTFRLDNNGGKKIQLTYPARVEFNGEGLAYRSAFGDYNLTNFGNEISGAFKYSDHDGNVYTNSIEALSAIELPFGLTSISQNGNFFLPWQGDALRSGETVRVKITAGTSRTFTTTAVGANHILLDENSLKQLVPGNATIQIERESYKGLEQSNLSGGRITSTYKSRKVFITITN